MKLRLSHRGSSLIETLMAVGILGMIAYFVVGMLKNGTVGQKTLQSQDDVRTITDNMASVLSDALACRLTFGPTPQPSPPIKPATGASVDALIDSTGRAVYTKGQKYSAKSLLLTSIKIGGSGTDAKTGIPRWSVQGSGGSAFVEVTFEQALVASGNAQGPKDLVRYFMVNVTNLNADGTIAACTAQTASGAQALWTLNGAGAIYNANIPPNGSGAVGVGTATPTGAFDVFTGTRHGLIVDSSTAYVGIGVTPPTTPSAPLHVWSSGGNWGAWNSADFKIGDSANHLNVSVATGGAGAGDVRLYAGGATMQRMILGTGAAQNDAFVVWNDKVGVGYDLTTITATSWAYPFQVRGDMQATGDVHAVSFVSTSDARLKTDVKPVDGLEKILQLRGVAFTWLKERTPGMGVIAQEVEKVFPFLVVTDKGTGYKAVRYEGLIAPLIEAVKDLYRMCRAALDLSAENSRRVAALEQSNAAKDAAILELRQRLEAQERELAGIRAKLGKR